MSSGMPAVDPKDIALAAKRAEIRSKLKRERRAKKSAVRRKRRRQDSELAEAGEPVPARKVPKTLDNTREYDETMISGPDEELVEESALDNFASYFDDSVTPKLLWTTNMKPHKAVYGPLGDLMKVFPNSHFRKRGTYELTKVIEYASERGYTDLIVMAEHRKKPSALYVIHLPNGPSMQFKISNFKRAKEVRRYGKDSTPSRHYPELVLNNFNTRLGATVGRLFAALLPQRPQFHGRQVLTFHNQRDFIFLRYHRYIFESKKKARLQELGPQLTLKLRWVQTGAYDPKFGEFEWVLKKEMVTSRRRFFL